MRAMDMTQEFPVRVQRMEPMRMAAASVVAGDAEKQAVRRLLAWAEAGGLLGGGQERIFGFDNCLTDPDQHRYTAMIPVGADVVGDGDVTVMDVPGGSYAITTVRGVSSVHHAWEQLEAWPDAHGYRRGAGQWFEEIKSPVDAAADDLVLDLYLPVAR